MLFKLALQNIQKKRKNYLSYYTSSSFSIFALYLFISVYYNASVRTALGSMQSIMYLWIISSVLITFFSAFFIWYSNSFFIRSRKKEFATYMLLGMSKKQTVFLNFVENTAVLLAAFVTGILAGMLLNKLLIMILFSVMQTGGNVPFQISVSALKICAIIYLIIFALISLHSAVLLYKNSLLDLLNASKRAEKALSISKTTVFIALLSVLLIGTGYYIAIYKFVSAFMLFAMPLTVLLVCLGSFLLFTGLASLVLYLSKKGEKRLFKGTRLVTMSQLFFRYKGNVGTLSMIAITTSVAFSAVLFCCGLYGHAIENTHTYEPFSVEFYNTANADSTFSSILSKHSESQIRSHTEMQFAKVKVNGQSWSVLSESDYDKANAALGSDVRANLGGDNTCLLIDAMTNLTGKPVIITAGSAQISLTATAATAKNVISADHSIQTVVVKDSVFEAVQKDLGNSKVSVIEGYNLKNDLNAKSFVADLDKNMPKQSKAVTFYDNLMDTAKLDGMLFFIGVFIGLVFLIATGSIIQFKMAMEAAADKDKFVTLCHIGANRREIRSAVAKELGIIFGAPFVIATLNAFVAKIPLEQLINLTLGKTFIGIVLVYAALYGIYYLITLHSYVKTVCD